MYHESASNYEIANRFGSISKSHQCAIAQIKNTTLTQKQTCHVLDLGVGNGEFLRQLKHILPKAQFTGIDLSESMLNLARSKLDLTTIEASATEADHYLPSHSQDLVLAHFINAYIPINTLFNQASVLSRPNGYFSLITTTYESFPIAQQQLAGFISEDSLLSSIVGHYYKAIVKNTTVASGQEELFQTFDQHKFKIISHERLQIPITINNMDELAFFGVEGTWFLNHLSIRMLPKNFLLQRLKRLFGRIFTFPYHDTHLIDIVLASK